MPRLLRYYADFEVDGRLSIQRIRLYLLHNSSKFLWGIGGQDEYIKKYEAICPSIASDPGAGQSFKALAKVLHQQRLYRWAAALGLRP
jgi:hypothetical protein